MAEKYAGRKFDDPDTAVDTSANKVYSTFDEKFRRALQGIANRVIGGTNGTQGPLVLAECAIGTTAGFKTSNDVCVCINGVHSTAIAQDNLYMPEGTMGTNTVAKFLICTSTGTSGTILQGNVVDKGNYANATLAAAACKLPDLPDGYCALGYVTLNAPAATVLAFSRSAGFALGGGGTAGTAAYQDLVCMPYNA